MFSNSANEQRLADIEERISKLERRKGATWQAVFKKSLMIVTGHLGSPKTTTIEGRGIVREFADSDFVSVALEGADQVNIYSKHEISGMYLDVVENAKQGAKESG